MTSEQWVKQNMSTGSIVLVGNGNISDMGKEIDAFDHVVRFNEFKIDGYEEHVGTKTTVHFACSAFKGIRRHKDAQFMSGHTRGFLTSFGKRSQREEELLRREKEGFIYPETDYRTRFPYHYELLSSGILCLLMLKECVPHQTVHLVGFDFFQTAHYFDGHHEHPKAHQKSANNERRWVYQQKHVQMLTPKLPESTEKAVQNLKGSIVVVGNGKIVNHGEFIDSFDNVIRFNRFQTEGYEKHVGTKTTVHCVGFVLQSIKPAHGAGVFCNPRPLGVYHKWFKQDTFQKEMTKRKPYGYTFAEYDHLDKVSLPENAEPTTGFCMVHLLLNALPDREITLIGFDFLESGHYFDKSHRHAKQHFDAQKAERESLLSQSRLRVL